VADVIFIELAVILFIAFVVSYIAKSFKQPLVIGYIVAGIIISPFILKLGASQEIIKIFSEFGIAFLLFMVGLHLNPKIIREIGASSLFVGLIQIVLTFILGFLVSLQLLNFNLITSIYIGIALSFSSTIIIMKLISDKRQLDTLYGKLSIGILIIQDFAAIAVLMIISSVSGNSNQSLLEFASRSLLMGGSLIVLLFLIGVFILPKVTKSIAKSQELLFLFSIAWAFVISALFMYIGFSLEIGALIAGMVLSLSPYSTEISSRIRPIRDFFLIIFFIILGLNVNITSISSIIYPAIILSILALLFKPIIIMALLAVMGYTKRTNFVTGTTLAQISEFSLIVLGLGVAVGHIAPEILYMLTLTGIITITLSTYMIIYSNAFYKLMERPASIFQKTNLKRKRKIGKKYDAILFGYNRMGFSILKSLQKVKKKYLVVDFNPDTVENLNKLRIPSLYGDAYDQDLIDDLPIDKIKIAISTVPDFETNYLLIEDIRRVNPDAIIIARAHTIDDAFNLYKKGANYVLTPHFLGGEYLAKMIKDYKIDKKDYQKEKEKHIKMLTERIGKGHEPPPMEEKDIED
jgi:Kef-type K+ transport system membrane component KefB/Trk K+ transport system NAD-binding subunit